ncbi:polysaccharide pyruvyl transferase family protein [Treponema sp.]|uniref:polysaccharide pyruvyl transferase family protein n=1 Tax=Treponema sp. TaxID=166 RepID=UPI003F0370CC
MKIAIVNQPLANRGDEAAHKAFLRAICRKFPGYQIDVVFLCVEQTLIDLIKVNAKNVSYINIPKIRGFSRFEQLGFLLDNFAFSYLHPALRKFHRLLKIYDKVVCAPGGMCMGGFLNWDHIWQLDVARRLKKPVLYWGRSIGPFTEENFKKKFFKKYSVRLLKYFSYISLRDKVSLDIARQFEVNANEVVDSAFLEIPSVKIPENMQKIIKDSEYIVLVPNSLTWHPRYKDIPQEKIDEFYLRIIKLLETKFADKKIVMLPQTYKSIINDYEYFLKLKELSNNQDIVVIDENQSSDVQQAIIKKAGFVIGARYHSIVFAINNEVPFVSLSYEHKMKGLLETLGMTSRMVEIQDIFDEKIGDYRRVLNKVETLFCEKQEMPSVQQARQIVQNGFERFCKELSK